MKKSSRSHFKFIFVALVFLLLRNTKTPAEELIAYDTGPFFTWEELIEVGTRWAVRFTPLQSCTLSYCEVASQGTAGSARLHLWLDDGFGYPAGDPILSKEIFLSGNLSYQRIDFDPKRDIGSGDFHIGIEYTHVPPPFTVGDNDGGTEARSKYKLPNEDWVVLSDNDLSIRAWVIYYEAEDLLPPVILHTDIPMGFTKGGDHLVEAAITDQSGVRRASVHYSINERDWTETQMDSLGDDSYRAYIPSQEAGTEVWYYILAVDNSPNQNVGYFPEGGSSDPIIFEVVEGWGIRYDDGQPESFFSRGFPQYDNNSCAVRMTPPVYPVEVSWCCAYVDDVQEFELAVYDVVDGLPADILAGPYQINAVAPPEWVNFEIPEEERPTIGFEDFFIVFNWLPDSPESPKVGTDESDPDLRSFFRFGENWSEWNSGDFMLRAAVTEIPEAVEDFDISSLPKELYLAQNYPNPFNAETQIEYWLDESREVSLRIFDLGGSLIAILDEGRREVGTHIVHWNGEDSASGIYFYRLTSEGLSQTRRMIFVK
jgi:hypothetical protein